MALEVSRTIENRTHFIRLKNLRFCFAKKFCAALRLTLLGLRCLFHLDINIYMIQYLLPMARNTVTGQTVKTQDLNGLRYTLQQRVLADAAADQCAAKMTARTGDQWQGFVREYTPRERS